MRVTPEDVARIQAETNLTFEGWVRHKPFTIRDNARIEAPALFASAPGFIFEFGAYSIIRPGGEPNSLDVGRFSAIGPNFYSGAPEHNIEWVGTSSVFIMNYDWARKPGHDSDIVVPKRGFHVARTKIGSDVWIGRNVYLRPGITVGHGAIIGAHSVVTRDVEPYSIVAGNPAKVIRSRFPKEIVERLLAIHWWDYDPAWMRRADVRNVNETLDLFEKNGADLKPFRPDVVIFAPDGIKIEKSE